MTRIRYEELPLGELASYPLLEACYRAWRASWRDHDLPAGIDPLDLPGQVLPMVMLLDLETEPPPGLLRVRLAGTGVCELHGGELKGKTTDDFFAPEDAARVVAAALAVAKTREASLARRAFVSLNGRIWRYVRLIMPLSRDGKAVDSFFKVADPRTMGLIEK